MHNKLMRELLFQITKLLLRVKISVTLQFIKNPNIMEDPSDRLSVSLTDKFLCLCSECCIRHNDDEF